MMEFGMFVSTTTPNSIQRMNFAGETRTPVSPWETHSAKEFEPLSRLPTPDFEPKELHRSVPLSQ
jgi:hypothetical protein